MNFILFNWFPGFSGDAQHYEVTQSFIASQMQDNVNAFGVLEALLRITVKELQKDVAETAH